MIEKIKDTFATLGEKIGVSGTAAAIIVLAICVALIALIAILIAKSTKKEENFDDPSQEEEFTEEDESAEISEYSSQEDDAEARAEEPATASAAEQSADVKDDTTPLPAPAKTEAQEKKQEEKPKREKGENGAQKSTATGKESTPPLPQKQEKAQKRMLGKWRVVEKGDGAYIAALCASNGEVMLTSEIYSTQEGARNGIATIVKGVETGNFVIYRDKGGDYYYKLKNAGNRLLCVGEIYKTKDGCEKAAESVRRIAKNSPIVDEVFEGERFIDYTPAEVVPPAKTGKWKIEQSENGGFSAKLYANNGQLMLSTEEVATKKTAEKAIDAVRKNCADGNFFIDKDKFGRFYYKLHNTQRSVICTGETYDTVDGVVSAIESVRRFASNAEYSE